MIQFIVSYRIDVNCNYTLYCIIYGTFMIARLCTINDHELKILCAVELKNWSNQWEWRQTVLFQFIRELVIKNQSF